MSLVPCSTASTLSPPSSGTRRWTTSSSTRPSGRAADQVAKRGLRTRRELPSSVTGPANRYGPVPSGGVGWGSGGVSAGTTAVVIHAIR